VILHLMKLRVLLYGWSCFSEMRPASLLKATVADGPQPPLACGQDQWSEGTMLHLEDTVFICSPFLTFMSSVASVRGECAVRWCVGVEDSDVLSGVIGLPFLQVSANKSTHV